jgi:hypothetical protein
MYECLSKLSNSQNAAKGVFYVLRILKIKKFQKQIILFSILPKHERKSSILVYQATRIEDFRSFFGRIESKKICF